ncbi:MAG: cobalt-factor II C(20)-methyltransferase [Methanospirillum sp.]|uniref:cobalt-factor II C(20)-methyltransferase n=1 Tax=Methanospirillum sp. TaxID=45200 RepID=UPI0023759807|nr:cobalt-factor II C(20)-methyltransferase [Methanospirillum sp.]MDD1729280.1 cobalt-factor II C(20)-methyltransferase [Methanospirillum sp.]
MLTAVGLGPGDPELLTLKAVRYLKEADQVFVPGGIARKLVEPYCTPVELPFPMSRDEKVVSKQIADNAAIIARVAMTGNAVFGIIGDPNIFSTFSRLCVVIRMQYQDIQISTVPGVSSITALTSITGIPITGGFSVSDGSPEVARIQMKVTKPRETVDHLRNEGYSRFVLVERMYMEGMAIWDHELPEESNYFSLVFAEKRP